MGKPRKPGEKERVKPTNKEQDARIEQVGMCLSQGKTKSQLHAIFCERFDVCWRTVDRYITRARQVAMERMCKTKQEAICEAVSFYEGITGDPKSPMKDRMQARERLDKIFGVYQPTQVRLGSDPGAPIQAQVINVNVDNTVKAPEPTTEQLLRWVAEDSTALKGD